ncbi:ABC transporter permease [Amycolatopsis rhizosphaerae]|uniref:Transport permease protein n=1 Tax=Amycolatopsis rhizosphaerae TaxID=2053003 RepID=A0A558DKD1_9PSEU|nr:ABC transporter permease [Amycolatopsis rhizosphaerae]TVT61470.1 ABC transporter permease [Amycolatopsis rhizosphaerae]
MTAAVKAISDGAIIAKRNLIKVKRSPEIIVMMLISPFMFILLFAFVFGNVIHIPGGNYREYLLGGIFAQTIMFGATFTGLGVAEDVQKGVIDRYRSLPASRSAVLVGRTTSDIVPNALSIGVMMLTGLLVGWRIRSSFLEAVLGVLLVLLFAYAFSWVMAYFGLLVPSVEVFNSATAVIVFPLTLLATTFVPAEPLPAVVRTFAEWNPVSAIAQATRELFGNISAATPVPEAWPLREPVVYSLLWVAGILLVFVPLAVRQYGRTTNR